MLTSTSLGEFLINNLQEYPKFSCKFVFEPQNEEKGKKKVFNAVTELFAFFLTQNARTNVMETKLKSLGIEFVAEPFNSLTDQQLIYFHGYLNAALCCELKKQSDTVNPCLVLSTDYHPEEILAKVFRLALEKNGYLYAKTVPGNNILPFKSSVTLEIQKNNIHLFVNFNRYNYFNMTKDYGEVFLECNEIT